MSDPVYDDSNVFARILRGEIPCRKVHEDAHTLAFHDVSPQAPTHILVVPKGRYVSIDDFSARATDEEIAALWRAVAKLAAEVGGRESGYRVLANHGGDGCQTVFHCHVHILAGRLLGPLVYPAPAG